VGGGVGVGSGPKKNYTAIVQFREGKVSNVRYFED
jgi:ketosteroid isomerase-like protein